MAGELPEGSTATDLVLTVTQMLRERGVVGKFVEFFGPGLATLPLADRATIGNMAPEYGATCGIFPVDAETLRYLDFSGRPAEQVALVEAYCREQGLFHDEGSRGRRVLRHARARPRRRRAEPGGPEAAAGPGGPLGRRRATSSRSSPSCSPTGTRRSAPAEEASAESFPASDPPSPAGEGLPSEPGHEHAGTAVAERERSDGLDHGAVVIAAITSCTNTSNPSVMIGAGLLAKKAVEAGLERRPWVKTSLAPGSKVVTDYLERAGLIEPLSSSSASTSSATAAPPASATRGRCPRRSRSEIEERDLAVCSVLSGNRNFEGRIHPEVKMNYLASPPLCVAYALAGRMDVDITTEPLQGDVRLRDIWPTQQEIAARDRAGDRVGHVPQQLRRGVRGRRHLEGPAGAGGRPLRLGPGLDLRQAPALLRRHAGARRPRASTAIEGARCLALLGDSVTTDHISPAGAIKTDSPAGQLPDRARRRAARTSTPTAHGAATTR